MTLRAGVIGLGVGEQHAAAYAAHRAARLVAVCDLDEAKLERAARRHPGVLTTTDEDELLALDLDVVSIASYDDSHHRQAKLALEHGMHVFAEKPLCVREDEAEDLAQALAARPSLRLSSNLILRTSPRFRLLKELVGAGRLGRLYYLEGDYEYGRLHKLTEGWRGELERYSVFLGGAVHMVDLLLWLVNEPVVEVTARGNRIATAGTRFGGCDLVVATLVFESGIVGKVTANFAAVGPHFHPLKVFGTKGTFKNAIGPASLITADGLELLEAPYPGLSKGDLLTGFLDGLASGAPAAVPAGDVFRALEVCFAVERALKTAETVPIRPIGTFTR